MEESITKRTEALQQAMTLQAGDKDSRIRMVMDQIKQQEQEVFDAMQQVTNPKLSPPPNTPWLCGPGHEPPLALGCRRA